MARYPSLEGHQDYTPGMRSICPTMVPVTNDIAVTVPSPGRAQVLTQSKMTMADN